MTTIFNEIISINNEENILRSDPKIITDLLVKPIKIEELKYKYYDLKEFIVLTGSKNKDTITDNDFNREFSKKTCDLLTYINWDNVVVAGGALVNIITNNTNKLNDIDLFIYDLDIENAILKVEHIVDAIKQKTKDMNYEIRTYVNKNVINIYVFDTKKILQIQIILRLYTTMAHILIGFDVDCCAIAYNGKTILITERGLNSFRYRVNVASLERRSPSYENRLIKYSIRGFDVITNFEYEKIYNKLFFMKSDKFGFTRLLEQELINNGQLKNIIFSNTLRFRQTQNYINTNYSFYGKENLEIKNVANIENCITKFNANIEDDSMKFKEYSIKNINFMQRNTMDQLTGSFEPITDQDWIDGQNNCKDPLGRSKEFLDLKYNTYSNSNDFENLEIFDISNFDAKCLAVMYVENEKDVIKIIENKYIPKKNNMYKIEPVKLAILLSRTKLAEILMKGHKYETVKELIYMMDNDKLFTKYCNYAEISYTEVDKILVEKYACENISDNIHNQNINNNLIDEFYNLTPLQMSIKLALEPIQSYYSKLDISKIPYEVIKILYEKNIFTYQILKNYIIKKFNEEELNTFYDSFNSNEQENNLYKYVLNRFYFNENKKSKEASDNIIKLFKNKGLWKETDSNVSIYEIFNKIFFTYPNLYTCMLNIFDENLTLDIIMKLLGNSKAFDMLFDYVLFLDDIKLVQKLIIKDDLYVKLKYHYIVSKDLNPKIYELFEQLEKERVNDKIKNNKILKNNEFHTNALNDGILSDNYIRDENVFGMTPDDNIIAKLLLLYNKVFNKLEKMNDKDLQTLKNMRKSVNVIKRNNEFNIVDEDYFYSLELHKLFFDKNIQNITQTNIENIDESV